MLFYSLLTAFLLCMLSSFDYGIDSIVHSRKLRHSIKFIQHYNNYIYHHRSKVSWIQYKNECSINRMVTCLCAGGDVSNPSTVHPKLNFNEDFYSVLEVSPTGDSKTVKKAYLKMVFKVCFMLYI
jgi:DnaJ-domain-containing protein 1